VCWNNKMNGLIVLAACVCASSAQLLHARAFDPAPSHQFHAQDEFGQFSFGHAGGPSARTESRNAYGVTTGSYQYIDGNGLLQTVNYISDPVHGFRVAGTNLPVGPAVPAAAPLAAPVFALEAPVFDLPLPVAVEDTPEVAAAKAEFKAAYDAAAAAAAAAPEERKRRDADEEVAPAVAISPLGLGYPYAHGLGLHGLYAAAPGEIVASIAPATPVHAPVGLGYAGLGYHGFGLPHGLTYAAAPVEAAAPLALPAAAPSREAVLTTIKANPGHAIVYTVA